MFKPLSLFIGLRYTRAKKRNHFISFISLVSMIGIALGVMVLITVLSVMNGFDKEIRTRILDMVPQITISGWAGNLHHWQGVRDKLKSDPRITGMAPFVQGQAMLSTGQTSSFVMLEGIDPSMQGAVSNIGKKLISGNLNNLVPGGFGIILGKDLADSMGVSVGNQVTVVVPQGGLSPAGLLPRLKQFKVVGIFSVGYQYDSSYALVNMQDAAKLLLLGDNVTGLQLQMQDLYIAPAYAEALRNSLPPYYQVLDWTEQNANFFKALRMEKVMMFLILLLIIAVAAFNMLASLVMLVTDKEADIAILRTLGLRSRSIMAIFMVQGTVIGMVGTLLGLLGGLLLAFNVTRIVNLIQSLFNVQFLSSSVYYIDFVPTDVEARDVVLISLVSLALAVLSTLYPAWRASKIQPAEALRYE